MKEVWSSINDANSTGYSYEGGENGPSTLALTINKNKFQINLRSKCKIGKAKDTNKQITKTTISNDSTHMKRYSFSRKWKVKNILIHFYIIDL